MDRSDLHIIVVHFNPNRWASHKRHRTEFMARYADCGAPIHLVELAMGDRDFEILDPTNPLHIGLRTNVEVPWVKENLINIGISRLPVSAKYVAWIDGDIIFANPNWVMDTLHELQHAPVIQMFSECMDLGPSRQAIPGERGKHDYIRSSFAKLYVEDRGGFRPKSSIPYVKEHCGYAWAARLDFLIKLDLHHPLIDWSIIGAADYQMACNFTDMPQYAFHGDVDASFVAKNSTWHKRAVAYGGKDLSFVNGTVLHEFHGLKQNRKYVERWNLLLDYHFDPDLDIMYRPDGLIQWTNRNMPLQLAYRDHSRSRNEDSIDT